MDFDVMYIQFKHIYSANYFLFDTYPETLDSSFSLLYSLETAPTWFLLLPGFCWSNVHQ